MCVCVCVQAYTCMRMSLAPTPLCVCAHARMCTFGSERCVQVRDAQVARTIRTPSGHSRLGHKDDNRRSGVISCTLRPTPGCRVLHTRSRRGTCGDKRSRNKEKTRHSRSFSVPSKVSDFAGMTGPGSGALHDKPEAIGSLKPTEDRVTSA